MGTFWNSEEGKILSYGLHEHGNAICNISTNITLLKVYSEKNKLTTEELEERLISMQKSVKRANDAIDYIYTKFKDRFNETNNL